MIVRYPLYELGGEELICFYARDFRIRVQITFENNSTYLSLNFLLFFLSKFSFLAFNNQCKHFLELFLPASVDLVCSISSETYVFRE